MTRGEIGREAVLKALGEFDRAGRDGFLEHHGFDRAERYYVQYDGRLYDAKAILNVAHHHEHGALPDPVISGGRAHSNRLLAALGFAIVDSQPASIEGERA